MNPIIEEYYRKAHIPVFLLRVKDSKLTNHAEIAEEFAFWIQTGRYKDDKTCVHVKEYTAEKLAALSPFLDGEGAFMMLIDLLDDPDKAYKKLADGFKIK